MTMRPDYAAIARLELELGYRRLPDTMPEIHARLKEIDEDYSVGIAMPPDVMHEWKMLVCRLEELRLATEHERIVASLNAQLGGTS